MMSPQLQEDQVRKILSDLTNIPSSEIKAGDRLREDLGLDSVGSMELLSMLAETFDIDVEMEEAAAVSDVAGLMALARRHLA
jgi:acyl carrier protein